MGYQKSGKLQKLSKQPPSPPRQPPRATWSSHTRREIERFWRMKRLVEQDHLLHALQAASHPKAIHLSKEDYRLILDSLEEIKIMEEDVSNRDLHVGVKDWWTKSKYAYLN
ncbi:hypothetical protein RND81_09G148500 [Saponaria officinalis]|uniref:Uncharacterized protein n=1 Tax=Saponaria officinalis TaxID=3572 RepID=A0AAW1IMW4_SAPOF